MFHARIKHIELNFIFIHDKVFKNQLRIQYLLSSDQIANIFTKHISSFQFFRFWTKFSVVPKPMSVRGDDRPQLHQQQSQLHQQHKAVATTELNKTHHSRTVQVVRNLVV